MTLSAMRKYKRMCRCVDVSMLRRVGVELNSLNRERVVRLATAVAQAKQSFHGRPHFTEDRIGWAQAIGCLCPVPSFYLMPVCRVWNVHESRVSRSHAGK